MADAAYYREYYHRRKAEGRPVRRHADRREYMREYNKRRKRCRVYQMKPVEPEYVSTPPMSWLQQHFASRIF